MSHQANDEERTITVPTHTRAQGVNVWPDCVPAMKADFLEEFVKNGGVITAAAKAVGTTARTIYNWLKADDEFALSFEEARQASNDTIRTEIIRRATEGWQREVYQQGRFVGYETVKSDVLLMFHAKSRMPEYRDRVDITSNDQHINAHETIVEAAHDPETSELAAQLLERIATQASGTTDPGATASDDTSGLRLGDE